jgi:acyl carrier protein
MTVEEVRAHILAAVGRKDTAPGSAEDFDLRTDGAVDSLGFIRLISELETRAGRPLDLSGLEPEKLTRLNALAAHVAGQTNNSHDPRS